MELNNIAKAVISYGTLQDFWDNYAEVNGVKNNRERHNVIHRHAFMVIARNNVNLPLQKIGKIFNRDHATVIHACKNHESNYKYDPDYRIVYDNLAIDVEDLLLENGIVPKTISNQESVSDVHYKFLNVSRRLRKKIKEFELYKVKIKKDIERAESLQKHFNELNLRNQLLNQELKRVKNLL